MTALFSKSHFSIGESLISPGKLIDLAVEHGYDTVCLADTMTISGMIDFSKKAKKAGIRGIVGVRLRIVDDPAYRPPKKNSSEKPKKTNEWYPKLYAKNENGLKRIMRLLSLANSEEYFYRVPRLGLNDLIKELESDDVVMTTGDVLSVFHHHRASEILDEVGRALKRSDVYVELCPVDTPVFDRVNADAIRLARDKGLPTLLTRPCLYAQGQADTLDVLNAISRNIEMSNIFHNEPYSRDLAPASITDMVKMAADTKKRIARRYPTLEQGDVWKQSILNHAMFVDPIDYVWDKMDISLPKMAEDEYAGVVKICKEGWAKRLGSSVFGYQPDHDQLVNEYKPRLAYELGVLNKMGFCGYFLLVHDIVNWSKRNEIMVGPGRGSVGGSLVAYLMGITDVDPIRFGLLFERFINPDRIDLPDADLDFMSERRHEVIEYIVKRYGENKVAGISNYNALASASALRDAGRVMGLTPKDLSCSKLVPKMHGASASLEEAAKEVIEIDDFRTRHPKVWSHALNLDGAIRSLGRHAAGVVVAGEPLVERSVVERRSGEATINWDKRVSEEMGLVKLDILGLSTLDTLSLAVRHIRKRHSKTIDLTALPLDDPAVLEAFGKGDTIGVFQFESGGMRKLLKDLASYEPLSFDDISAATALYRPGPMDSGLMDDYVAIKQGVGGVVYDHPNMEDALKETYGVIVYQEQVMQVARDLAGFTMTESDHLRKAMGKKDKEKMAEFHDKWVEGCFKHSGMDKDHAADLFDKIEKFAGYGFNKSHAVEYSLISYIAMWLKLYYPVEYYAASLTVIANKTANDRDAKLRALLKDARGRGIETLPPDINNSTNVFEILTDTKLTMPFQAIKAISGNTTNAILKAREDGPFKDLEDFLSRVEKRRCNVRHRENLDKVGAFARIIPGSMPANHPDRLKDQMELLPGLIIDLVKAGRKIEKTKFSVARISEIITEYRAAHGVMLPRPSFGKSPYFMVITDAPTWKEEESGVIGKASTFEYISEALAVNKLSKDGGYFTCLSKATKEGSLERDQIARYLPYLKREIEILKPPIIVLLGSTTARQFVKGMRGSIMENCGNVVFDPVLDASLVIGISPGMVSFDGGKQELLNKVFERVAEIAGDGA